MNRILLLSVLVLTVSIVNAQVINFPDPAFKAILLQANTSNNIAGGVKIDANNDGEITQSEALAVFYSSIQTSENITNITGIGFFANLQTFQLLDNLLQTADLSDLTNLQSLDLGANQLTSVNLNGLSNLWFIQLGGNQLTEVDFSTLAALKILIIDQNPLTHLDFSNNPMFEQLRCYDNPNLRWINIRNNHSQTFTQTAYNGCWNNPNLTTICVDDNEVLPAQNFLTHCGITQPITITTDCALGINEEENHSDLVIYPNPSTDGMFILVFDEKINNGTIEVYNLLGQKVAQDTIQNATEHQLNMPIAAGTYILKFNNGSEQITKRVIIK